MEWKKYFYETMIKRGRQYYNSGRVKRLHYTNGQWTAIVRGSRHYSVKIRLDENGEIRRMSCDCPFADGGENCKHMAAVLMAIEEEQKKDVQEEEVQQLQPDAAETEKAVSVPFPKMAARSDYIYFDLNYMVRDMEVSDRVWSKGRQASVHGDLQLDRVDIGYTSSYYGNELVGAAYGTARQKNREYGINIYFDKEKIRSASCGCPGCSGRYDAGFSRYFNKICSHETALLYLLEDYLMKYNPGDATDSTASRLFQHYQTRHANLVRADLNERTQILHIEPRLEGGNVLSVSFRTGIDKLYVVKNLTEFVEQVENGSEAVFGTKTRINFAGCRLDEKSEKYFQFIRKAVNDELRRQDRLNGRAGYYDSTAIKDSIALTGPWLDEFYRLIKDEKTEYTFWNGDGKQKRMIGCDEKTPEISLTIRPWKDDRDIFQGVHVYGTMEKLMEGNEAYYYVDDGVNCLERVGREAMKDILPLYRMSGNGSISFDVGRKSLSEFYYTVLPIFRQYGTVVEENRDMLDNYLPPEVCFRFYLDAEEENLLCRADAVYGEKVFSIIDTLKEKGDDYRDAVRDMNREAEAVYRVTRYFPEIDIQEGVFHCGREEEKIYQVLNQGLDELMAFGEVHTTERFKRLNIRRIPKISVGVSIESDLLQLTVGSEELSREELLEALNSYRRKKKYFRLKNGSFVNIEGDSIEVLGELMEAMHVTPREFVQGKMQFPVYRALYLDKMLEQSNGIYSKRDSHFRRLVKEFKTVNDSDYEIPESLQKIMRNYQIAGYKWLRTLEACHFGGILADDMGLGKTLQMIAVLLAWKNEGRRGTSLIVSPASLVYNWQEELSRFAPQLNVCMVTGTQKERSEKLKHYGDYDVLVTSYDLLKRDIAGYEDCSFLCQVLDEAQFIKNHTTAAAKAVKLIHSNIKYALTGTPIENRLSEMWSIFDFLMPGFLYGYDVFKKEIETPIVKNQDKDAMERLKRMVSPFILRRLKKDVLKDLPDKLEKVHYAKFDNAQQKLYDGQVTHMQLLLEQQQDSDFGREKLKILAELTRIRQICCDPSLIYEDYKGGSAKREACMELIQQGIEGEHRMLIFSQFTSMLELLEKELDDRRIPYYKITGETPKEKRIQMVHDFNEGDTPVFLISLKAGGTGLNLTGADMVIHYDPWWNLAVQNQATDRAHRIGQTNTVTVYKLIAKDSVEEKILKMQEKKKDLAEEILSGETGGLSALSKEELLELLSL